MRRDRRLDREESAVGLHHADVIAGNAERRKASHHVRRVQHLVRQAVRARGAQRAGHDRAVGRADLDDAGDVHELPAGRRLELAPELIGAAQQRHVGRMLEIAEPDDAGLAVRGAAVMARRESLDADDAQPAARKLIQRGAAHRAEPDHRHVVFAPLANDPIERQRPFDYIRARQMRATFQEMPMPRVIRLQSDSNAHDRPWRVAVEQGFFADEGLTSSTTRTIPKGVAGRVEDFSQRWKESQLQQGALEVYPVCEWGAIERVQALGKGKIIGLDTTVRTGAIMVRKDSQVQSSRTCATCRSR